MFKRRRRARGARGDETDDLIQGIARLDTRTKRLIGRLQPGEIAFIDHDDLDRVAAEGLVERKVKAVINASASSTGRYPNLGPLILIGAGIPLLDSVGAEIFEKVREGDVVKIEDARIFAGGSIVGKGHLVTMETAQENLDKSKLEIGTALEKFAENTLQYMVAERDILLEPSRLPEIKTQMAGRHVLAVARGYGYKDDLALLSRAYIRDFHPVLIGIDGGADALLERRLRPDIIIGDMDSVTTEALTCGAELVLHAYQDGRAPGKDRLDALGLQYATFDAPGTSEDIALLLAHEKGADLIVAVGARASLIEFMDKGRKGMASTFLVRLRVGPKLVDAKGVSELHRPGPTNRQLIGLVVAAVVAMLMVIRISAPMQLVVEAIERWFGTLWFAIQRAIS